MTAFNFITKSVIGTAIVKKATDKAVLVEFGFNPIGSDSSRMLIEKTAWIPKSALIAKKDNVGDYMEFANWFKMQSSSISKPYWI